MVEREKHFEWRKVKEALAIAWLKTNTINQNSGSLDLSHIGLIL